MMEYLGMIKISLRWFRRSPEHDEKLSPRR